MGQTGTDVGTDLTPGQPYDPDSSKPRHHGLSELRFANPTVHKSMNPRVEDRLDQTDQPSDSNPRRL